MKKRQFTSTSTTSFPVPSKSNMASVLCVRGSQGHPQAGSWGRQKNFQISRISLPDLGLDPTIEGLAFCPKVQAFKHF